MTGQQPHVISAGPRKRHFITSAIAVQAIIINRAEQVLLLNSPTRNQGWQVVSGALEAKETLLGATLREVSEELGGELIVRPLGLVHAQTFHYDHQVQYMLSTHYLFEYQNGNIFPGDDMSGSKFQWWSLPDLEYKNLDMHPSTTIPLLKRAIQLFRLWVNEDYFPLQEELQGKSDFEF
jgi:8-oxo-dGTP pyrophosphatase MutT (NUDIX family)